MRSMPPLGGHNGGQERNARNYIGNSGNPVGAVQSEMAIGEFCGVVRIRPGFRVHKSRSGVSAGMRQSPTTSRPGEIGRRE